jgi:hypothetical protein
MGELAVSANEPHPATYPMETEEEADMIEAGANTSNLTRWLLWCGVIAGPLFVCSSLLQAMTRQGFDLTHHAISLLLLGDFGWMQRATFYATSLLAISYATGLWRALHPGDAGTWGPLLVGLYGVGFFVAGSFTPDAASGFPPGAPDIVPSSTSAQGGIHNLGFFTLVLAIVAASIVFARRFARLGQRGWAVCCAATAISAPALLIVGIAQSTRGQGGLALLGVALVTSAGLSLIAARLLAEAQ